MLLNFACRVYQFLASHQIACAECLSGKKLLEPELSRGAFACRIRGRAQIVIGPVASID